MRNEKQKTKGECAEFRSRLTTLLSVLCLANGTSLVEKLN